MSDESLITKNIRESKNTNTFKGSMYINKGDFVFLNTVPNRLYIEGGYVDIDFEHSKGTYNYYIHDNQGSVRAVVDENGILVQATDYSAYGVPSSGFGSTTSDKHLHLSLEWQPMKGIYGYYNNARFRDAILAGTLYQQDPLAEKYYPFTPYHYGKDNPSKNVDILGDSVAILNFQQKKNQHIGLLVQNKDMKWEYYSVNGTNMYIPGVIFGNDYGKFSGGNKYNNIGELKFQSVQTFFDSDYNKNNYNHDEAFVIPTTLNQDRIISKTFKSEANSTYNLFMNNCATAVANSLNKAGIKTYMGNDNKIYIFKVNSYIPSRLYKDIIKHNNGQRYTK